MSRRKILLPLLLLAVGLVLAGCGGDDDDSDDAAATTAQAGDGGGTLNGSVGPGFDISLDGTEGISAGDYTITVNDQSAQHNFHLTGPGGVDVATEVSAEGEESFDVTLEPGEYTFVCDPHASQMRGSFTVE